MITAHLAAVSVESRCFDIASLVGQLAAGSGSLTVVAMCFLCSTVYASTISPVVIDSGIIWSLSASTAHH